MKATKDKKASGAINSVNCHNSLVKYTRNERSIDLLFQSHARPPLPSLNCRVLAVDFVNSQDSRVVRFRLHYVLLSAALFLPSSLPPPPLSGFRHFNAPLRPASRDAYLRAFIRALAIAQIDVNSIKNAQTRGTMPRLRPNHTCRLVGSRFP